MSMRRTIRSGVTVVLVALGGLVVPAPAAAHCDSMDGPVVAAARKALALGQVEPALSWVRQEDEARIRSAFERTLDVRVLGDEARELADLWFFETLVRVHREGEGEPYTGLKPAGWKPPAGIAAADRALDDGSIDALSDRLGARTVAAVRERFQRVLDLRDHPAGDVEAGRRYVHAYVEYVHFVERLDALLDGSGAGHPDDIAAARHD